MLQQAGIGIQAVRSTQNQYNYIGREFDIAELKLLIDAVESSKFITKSKSEQLVVKLTSFAAMVDMTFVILQRYNRQRVKRLLDRRG